MRARRTSAAIALAALVLACRNSFVPDPENDVLRVPDPPTAPDAPTPSTPAPARASGTFSGLAGHSASGGVTLSVDGEGIATLELGADFVLGPQPDPHLYLNAAPTVRRGTPLRIGALQQDRGRQRYRFRLAAGAAASHVVIWCNRYDVGLAQAPLAQAP